jgi:RND family efflux transporter MFP subunit
MSSVESNRPRETLAKLRIPRGQPERPSGPSKKLRRTVLGLVLLALAGGGAWYAVQNQEGQQPAGWLAVPDVIRNRTEVRVVSPRSQKGRSADASVVATGYLESRQQAKIGARAPGRIEAVNVEEGTRVTQGEVLAVLEHADLDASYEAVKATHARAVAELGELDVEIARTKRQADRLTQLRASQSTSEAEYDQARFAYEAAVARRSTLEAAVTLAAARVQEAEQLRENMFIRAPFNATVISKDAEVGESIMPGGMGEASGRGSVVTIADLDHLEVECDVKEDFIGRIAIGQSAVVAVDAVPERRYEGRVRKVIPMGDRARATIKVQVEIVDVDERLFPEMSSTVYFLPEGAPEVSDPEKPRWFCPSSAVVHRDGKDYLWIANAASRLELLEVSLGARRDDEVEITAGLVGGEKIVAQPPNTLEPGQLVKLVE